MFDFTGKTAIVTGAGSGIGKATAEYFHACGAAVVAADLRFPDEAPPAERFLRVVYDAADPGSAQALVDRAVAAFGPVDHLVACAGIYEQQTADRMGDDEWRRTLAVNLDGVFYLVRRAVGQMRDGGAIVALASIAAHQGGSFGHSHYGAAKGGVLALVRGLARDLAPRLRVNAVSPGTIDTPMVARRLAEDREVVIRSIPMGRLGRPAEIASVCAFLCSDAASYVTGEAIIASGGLYMG